MTEHPETKVLKTIDVEMYAAITGQTVERAKEALATGWAQRNIAADPSTLTDEQLIHLASELSRQISTAMARANAVEFEQKKRERLVREAVRSDQPLVGYAYTDGWGTTVFVEGIAKGLVSCRYGIWPTKPMTIKEWYAGGFVNETVELRGRRVAAPSTGNPRLDYIKAAFCFDDDDEARAYMARIDLELIGS